MSYQYGTKGGPLLAAQAGGLPKRKATTTTVVEYKDRYFRVNNEYDTVSISADDALSGNLAAITVLKVDGNYGYVGVPRRGSNGGYFTINSNGAWTFDQSGDFSTLTGTDTADTSVTYHASDGVSEAMGTLTITVSASQHWTPAQIAGAVWVDANTVTLDGSTVSAMTDKIAGTITATQGTASEQPTLVANVLNGEPVLQFDGADWLSFGTALGRPSNWTIFAVAMYASQPSGATFLCGSQSVSGTACSWGSIGAGRTLNDGKLEYGYGNDAVYSWGRSSAAVISNSSWFLCCRRYTAGADRVADRINGVSSAVTKDSGTATSSAGQIYNFYIGRLRDTNDQNVPDGSRLKGFVCVPSAISDADAQRLEGYYAHLCGLTSLLPSDHPYKTAAPTL